MAVINDERVPVYDMDTKETLTTRIASLFKTLPKYLVFSGEFPQNLQETKLKATDILRVIREDAKKSVRFRELLRKLSPLPKGINVKEDLFLVWLAYNEAIQTATEQTPEYAELVLESFADDFVEDGYFSTSSEFTTFWKKERESFKRTFERKIEMQKNIDSDNKKLYGIFDDVKEGVKYTEFEMEKASIELKLNMPDVSLLEIFNKLILNPSVPFACCKDYYKILKDFVPPEEWALCHSDKVDVKVNPKIYQEEEYTNAEIKLVENQVISSFRLNTEKGYLTKDEFITRFLKVLPGVQYTSVTEKEVLGNFELSNTRLNSYVLSDLVMNDKAFSSLINIDEGAKATKKKGQVGEPWLYIHFNHPTTGHITAGINQKVDDMSTPYIRVRVRGPDKKSVENFQDLFSKLIIVYRERYEEIVAFYRQFLPGFGEEKEEKGEEKKIKRKGLSSEVFVKNYSRICKEDRIPNVSDKKSSGAMKFPRDYPGKGPAFPSDGLEQKYYTCSNPEYPFPGLQINKLSNSEEYPFVPCCFKNSQGEKEGGVYRHYFQGEELEVREKKQQELIVTDKILGMDKFGMLPDEVQRLFNIMDNEPGYKYVRMGVTRGYNSFLNCVLLGMYEQTGILDVPDNKIEDFVKKTKLELTDKNILPLALQNNFDSTLENLISQLSDESVYFNPKHFVQLLEGYFNCNIVVFGRERIVLPRYTQGYYTLKRDAPYVFVFEHMGSESDHAKYPQCELIVKWNEKSSDDVQYSFASSQKVSQNIEGVISILTESYALENKIVPIVFPFDKINIIAQGIDSYGKCRRLDVTHNKTVVTLFVSPIPPLMVPITDESFTSATAEQAVELMTLIKAQTLSQNVQYDIAVELTGKVGSVEVSIHLDNQAPIINIPINNTIGSHYPEKRKSKLEKYNRNKKLARYITEYMFWLFSTYVKDNGIKEITDKVLERFSRKKMILKEKYKYKGNIPKSFQTESILLENGKLIITSEEMMKRLLYVLKLSSIRNLQSLLSYHEKKSIINYYVDISDFDQTPGQVILHGEYSVEKWIQESRISYTINSEVVPGVHTPYFFKNNRVEEGRVFLAQNARDLKSAMEVCVNWQRRGFNTGYFGTGKLKKNYEFTLYSYKNKTDIDVYTIQGSTTAHTFYILGYKIGGIPYYTSLLPL